jgi:hypothetical protein
MKIKLWNLKKYLNISGLCLMNQKETALTLDMLDKIKALNPETCVEGHWEPVETSDTLADLLDS